MNNLLEELSASCAKEKIHKPNFNTKIGREFLAFYLSSKFKQVIAYDKKAEKQLLVEIKPDFLSNFLKRLINKPQERIMIAITGESASGKTTICGAISEAIERLNLPISILNADNYFNDISELIKIHGTFDALRDAGYDVDSPKSFQLDLLKEDLINLSRGYDIKSPEYLVNGTGISVPKQIPIKSNKIIVVEGMSSMYGDLADIFDIKIYVEIPDDIREKRFMQRAVLRNQDPENAKRHWNYVKDAGKKYVKSMRDKCEIVASGECDLNYFEDILEYLKTITNNFHEG